MSSADSWALTAEPGQRGLRRLSRTAEYVVRRPVLLVAIIVVGLWLVTAAFAPLIAPYGSSEPTSNYFQQPNRHHLFGTDNLGRDVFSRVVYGARVSLQVGSLAVLLGTVSGTCSG